ncbi:MAG: hypothetical protein RQ833_10530 [Sphingomonadaceae bacterium]|nr:hypothetical protein [Sphingomonadaceae bacterium]
MARFAATMKAVEQGLDNVSPGNGAKAANDWIEQLGEAEFRGAKGIARDLDRLVKELERDEPREVNVRRILAKLGPATEKAAEGAEGVNQDKLRELAKALTEAGQGHDAEAEDDADADA